MAIVDNDVVMQSQLDQRLNEVKQNITRRGAAAPPESELRQQVLERLIWKTSRCSWRPHGREVSTRNSIRPSPPSPSAMAWSVAEFRQALARDGLSYDAAREQVRREMMISRVRQRQVGQRVQVTPAGGAELPRLGPGQAAAVRRIPAGQHPDPGGDNAGNAGLDAAARQAQDYYNQLRQGADFNQWPSPARPGDNASTAARSAGARLPNCPRPSTPDRQCRRRVASPSPCAYWRLRDPQGGREAREARPASSTRCTSGTSCSSPMPCAAMPRPSVWPRACASASRTARASPPGQELLGRSGLGAQWRRPGLDQSGIPVPDSARS